MDAPFEFQANDIDISKKMEDEHLRLQRQVRMIQTDRLHRTMGVHPQFRRQDELLRTLKSEYVSLCKDLKIARSGAHKKKDKKMKQDLKKALLYRVKSEQECEAGVTVTQQIEELLQRNNKNTDHWRKIVNTTQGQIESRRIQSEMRLISTENKLETAQLRFNDVQYQNKKIREEIEHMLKDRALFNQSWDKMLSALNKGKKFLGDLFESSTLAYDQRDEWVAKLRSVQEKGKIDQMLQIQEMRDLMKSYNHEMKLYHFLAAKGLTRLNQKQEEREEQQKMKEQEEQLKQYDYHIQILEDVCSYTNEQSTKQIAQNFLATEQQNHSIYNMLVDCCAENEVLSREVRRIRQEACDRADWNDYKEDRRQKRLALLQKQLDIQRAKTDELRNRNEEKKTFLKEAANKIDNIFKFTLWYMTDWLPLTLGINNAGLKFTLKQMNILRFIAAMMLELTLNFMLDCSLEPFQNLLGDKQPTIYTLRLSLLQITEKIKEYKETVYYYERYMQKKSHTYSTSRLKKYTVRAEPIVSFVPTPITKIVPSDPCPSCVETRWLSRISDGQQNILEPPQVYEALSELSSDPAYLRSDRIHPLTECKVPSSRALLARRYMNY